MARTFPVLYTATAQTPAPPYGLDVRPLQTASPGTTDSTATQTNSYYAIENAYGLHPEQRRTNGGTSPAASPPDSYGPGWAIPVSDAALGGAGGAIQTAAGNWSFTIPVKRAGGLAAQDFVMKIILTLLRVRISDAAVIAEIGRGEVSFTVTTTKTDRVITVAAPGISFQPGEMVLARLYWNAAVGAILISDDVLFVTNSTTGFRLTSAPQFTAQKVANHVESIPLVEAHSRQVAYKRGQTEAVPVPSELHQSPATYRRTQLESVPVPGEAHKRVYMAVRGQPEAIPLTDLHARLVAYRRAQAEASSVAELHSRQVTYVRVQAENLTSGGGQVIIAPVFNVFG